MDLTPLEHATRSLTGRHRQHRVSALPATPTAPTAAERILAAEMAARGDSHDALSMMVDSIARMVQAGKTRDSRWKAS